MEPLDGQLLTGQRAIVTGGGSGIGAATCRRFAEQGAQVAVLDVVAERAEAVAAEVSGIACTVDVTDFDAFDAAVHDTADRLGGISVLFNNAGAGLTKPVSEIAYDEWQAVVDVNLTGTFLCAQAAFRVMAEQDPRGGRIINNGSISAYVPRPQAIAYNATKHAVTGITKSLSLEGREFDIACGQIDIGNAATDMTAGIAAGARQADGRVVPEPTFDVRHVAEAVLFMAGLPLDANVQFMTVTATTMPFIGRG